MFSWRRRISRHCTKRLRRRLHAAARRRTKSARASAGAKASYNVSMSIPDAVRALERDLRGIFGARLRSLVIYGRRAARSAVHGAGGDAHHGQHAEITTLAIIDSMTHDDLRAAANRVETWHDTGLATPLLIADREFERSLDAFPFEFGAILTDYEVVAGTDPFAGLTVDPADLRRACEVQARSHLLHLREGFLETRGRADAISLLIVRSAPPFAALVRSIARLDGHAGDDPASAARHVERSIGLPGGPVGEVAGLAGAHDLASARGERLWAPYLDAVEKLVAYVDGWSNAR
jgi:hypothetical protein